MVRIERHCQVPWYGLQKLLPTLIYFQQENSQNPFTITLASGFLITGGNQSSEPVLYGSLITYVAMCRLQVRGML